jgi:ADP-heptose:LPS heptosyltransferase
MDVPWLARGEAGASWAALIRRAWAWRSRKYDLVLNFEPDIRSNALAWLSGAPIRVGYSSGGGGALLTNAEPYEPGRHVSANAEALVARAARLVGARVPSAGSPAAPRLHVPAAAREGARQRLAGVVRPLVGVHVSGGRPSKQWHADRFASAASRIATERAATIVLTGGPADRDLVQDVERMLTGIAVVNTAGAMDLVDLAALLSELDVLVTGDTGPMHLAAAVGTPVVALFGPSDPGRYGPRATDERVLYADVPCRPCGLVRLPPARCRGHVPDCLDGIGVDQVVSATIELLGAGCPRARTRRETA